VREDLPTGTVTFLFTDVEGSTKLLHELGAEAYAEALAEHRRVVREACAAEGGVEVDTQGDAFFLAFASAPSAVAAAQAMTEALARGRIHLRIGLHTGTPVVTGEGYVGDDVHLAARVAAAGHGGQVVLSQATGALLDGHVLTDLGEHRLKDIKGAVAIAQLGDGSFPPLKTISNTNLPRPASSFVGRAAELAGVLSLVEDGSRLVTLTGPGGSGKTRLALEAAATLVPSYKAGTFWVGLAALRDPSLVTATIAQTIGSQNGLAEHIAEREMLLLLDNLEQVIEVAPELAALLRACPNLTLLVTSRELLRVQGEVEYEVPPLASAEAITLFCERSRLKPSAEIAELCGRLDDLPLALELAAARTKALSPRQILERLAQRLDLLRGGRDADPRQQTLRATIEWSYGLLSAEEQRLFRALSVFRGGCTLAAAEEVADAELDTLQSLVEKSLLRFSTERFWMLETVREYAREQLEAAGETDEHARRHAHYFLARLEANGPEFLGPRHSELLVWFSAEEDNLRAMLDYLSDVTPVDAARAAYLLHAYWAGPRGAFTEAEAKYAALLSGHALPDESRAMLLQRAADLAERLGHLETADAAVREAIALAESAGLRRVLADALRIGGWIAVKRGETDEAIRLAGRAVEEAAVLDEPTRLHAVHDLGCVLAEAGHNEDARAAFRRAAEEARAADLSFVETFSLLNLGKVDLVEYDYESARSAFRSVLDQYEELDEYTVGTFAWWGLGVASLGLDRPPEARAAFAEMFDLFLATDHTDRLCLALAASGIALTADPTDLVEAARLRGAVATLRQSVASSVSPQDDELERRFEQSLIDGLGRETYATEHTKGAGASLEETIQLTRSLVDS
jgi:predicted ATPase/class 3 adenylate cyclase